MENEPPPRRTPGLPGAAAAVKPQKGFLGDGRKAQSRRRRRAPKRLVLLTLSGARPVPPAPRREVARRGVVEQ